MAIRLQRKVRKKRIKAAQRKTTLKKLLTIPVIKRVSVKEKESI